MKEIYTFTTNKTASVSDFSLLFLDYLSRDDEDVKTFGALVEDMNGHTVMEIDSDEDTILFDRHLLKDVLKDIMNDVANLASANLASSDEDESEKRTPRMMKMRTVLMMTNGKWTTTRMTMKRTRILTAPP